MGIQTVAHLHAAFHDRKYNTSSAIGKGMQGLVLASGSPRRRELLALLGVPFEVVAPRVREDTPKGADIRELALELARRKAETVGYVRQGQVIVAADTLVVLGGQVMGKPRDDAAAWAMLRALRAREHEVTSGFAVRDPSTSATTVEAVETRVWMRNYPDDEVAEYIARNEPFDKAGAYAIQDPVFRPVAAIEGCYANVMGLPLCHLYVAMEHMGLRLPCSPPKACQAHTGHRCLVADEILGRANH